MGCGCKSGGGVRLSPAPLLAGGGALADVATGGGGGAWEGTAPGGGGGGANPLCTVGAGPFMSSSSGAASLCANPKERWSAGDPAAMMLCSIDGSDGEWEAAPRTPPPLLLPPPAAPAGDRCTGIGRDMGAECGGSKGRDEWMDGSGRLCGGRLNRIESNRRRRPKGQSVIHEAAQCHAFDSSCRTSQRCTHRTRWSAHSPSHPFTPSLADRVVHSANGSDSSASFRWFRRDSSILIQMNFPFGRMVPS